MNHSLPSLNSVTSCTSFFGQPVLPLKAHRNSLRGLQHRYDLREPISLTASRAFVAPFSRTSGRRIAANVSSSSGNSVPQSQPTYAPSSGDPVEFKVASYLEILRNSQVPLEKRERGLILKGDLKKEEHRLRRRNVFDFDQWREHRSVARYLRHLTTTSRSGIAQGLAGPLWTVGLISVLITVNETLLQQGVLPDGWIHLKIGNATAFSFMSFALSLLLVFRTNTSYGRWDEARKLWGLLVNRSRDLNRQVQSWFPEDDPKLLDMFVRWSSAFPHVLQAHLRETNELRTVLKDVLRPKELEALMSKEFRPNFVLSILSRIIDEAHLPTMNRLRCDENLTTFADVFGGCERLVKTPIPLTYTRHTSRFLIIYLICLPFALWNVCGIMLTPVSVAIAFLLLGIEEIGYQIEEPFGVLPLEVISATIQRNCEEMHARQKAVRASTPHSEDRSYSPSSMGVGRYSPRPLRTRPGAAHTSLAAQDARILATASTAAAAAAAAAADAAAAANQAATAADRDARARDARGSRGSDAKQLAQQF